MLIPILYLKGVSTGEFDEALIVLLGNDAGGLSASTVGRSAKIQKCGNVSPRASLTTEPALVRPVGLTDLPVRLTDLHRSHSRTGRPWTGLPTTAHGGGLAEIGREINALPSGQDHIA